MYVFVNSSYTHLLRAFLCSRKYFRPQGYHSEEEIQVLALLELNFGGRERKKEAGNNKENAGKILAGDE